MQIMVRQNRIWQQKNLQEISFIKFVEQKRQNCRNRNKTVMAAMDSKRPFAGATTLGRMTLT
jgi:hypothetical protein